MSDPKGLGASQADRPIGRVVRAAQSDDPRHLVGTLSAAVAEIGGDEVAVFLIDYAQTTLTPYGGDEPVASVEGTMAGRAFLSGRPLAAERDDGWHVWIPITERADRLGVLALRMPVWNAVREAFCAELGFVAAHLILVAGRYTDQVTLLRRSKEMSLAAEMQWALLPPLSFSLSNTHVAAMLEPAYEIGGDSFDYAVNGDLLELVMFDAMGHGVHSALLASLAMSAYRNCRRRRESHDLRVLLTSVDEAVARHGAGDSFLTGLVAQLDMTTGRFQWVSAGHPAPVHVRRASALPPVAFEPGFPLGLDVGPLVERTVEVVDTVLEPGDELLLFTDGVIEARNADNEEFGEDRLRDLLERECSSGRAPAELLRRLVQAVLTYQNAPLRDDASMIFLRWDGPPASAPPPGPTG